VAIPLIRNYASGDETGIMKLFNVVFPGKVDHSYWKWKFRDNPFGPPRISVAVDGDRIVGHFCLNPVPFWVDNREVLAAQGVDFMVDSSYREHGIGRDAAQLVVDQIEESADILFSYVFPMPQIQQYTQSTLGYQNVMQISSVVRLFSFASMFRPLTRKIPGLLSLLRRHDNSKMKHHAVSKNERPRDPNIREIASMDHRFDRLWEETRAEHHVCVVRNVKYLNWRYARSEYTTYALVNPKGLLGYVVVSDRASGSWHIGYIADLWTKNARAATRLIRSALDHFASRHVDLVRCWMSPFHPHYRVLRTHLFLPRSIPDRLMIRRYASAEPHSLLTNGQRWYLTLGDSDGV
jgi:RimJ/RimL family protein N-acetyltransferase